MQRNINILNELQEVAPDLVATATVMPHHVPEAYFESLPLLCLARVSAEVNAGQVPEGYFESLPGLLLDKVRALGENKDELDEIAPLLKTISRQPVGYVPEGYFHALETEYAARWFGNEHLTELKEVAPGLVKISQLNAGFVPDAYFDELPGRMLNMVQAPVRSIAPVRTQLRRAMAVAAAAIIVAGLWFGYDLIGSDANTQTTSTVLADNELKETPQIEEALHNIDVESIAIFLSETSATPVVSFSNPDDVESVIKTLNSETLENYLEIMPSYSDANPGETKS